MTLPRILVLGRQPARPQRFPIKGLDILQAHPRITNSGLRGVQLQQIASLQVAVISKYKMEVGKPSFGKVSAALQQMETLTGSGVGTGVNKGERESATLGGELNAGHMNLGC
jgi:hypothetical protein